MQKALLAATILSASLAGGMAAAEFRLEVYGGAQTSPHSRVKGDQPDGGTYNALIGWDGKSFSPPPYYGMRGTWWRTDTSGFALELTHAKVYAPDAERNAMGFDRFEFSDGHNIITVNYMRRWPGQFGEVTPYAGAGIGVAFPHVDVLSAGGEHTYGYQLTGPAARALAGVSYQLNDRWSLFGEYQFTISQNHAELDGGGDLDTRIITNAINVGVGFDF
ncbi:outer membrane protein [Mesobacterium pallidum]|uniref:outer membrane protein n=1 Tax=Mesobacterium pallidum TaxID=2872037 RepID=UPI001EE228C9|nr:outer membrane beta-barrel protein [Mesobacterium pallidum]